MSSATHGQFKKLIDDEPSKNASSVTVHYFGRDVRYYLISDEELELLDKHSLNSPVLCSVGSALLALPAAQAAQVFFEQKIPSLPYFAWVCVVAAIAVGLSLWGAGLFLNFRRRHTVSNIRRASQPLLETDWRSPLWMEGQKAQSNAARKKKRGSSQ